MGANHPNGDRKTWACVYVQSTYAKPQSGCRPPTSENAPRGAYTSRRATTTHLSIVHRYIQERTNLSDVPARNAMFRGSKAKLSRLPPGYWRHLCHKQPYSHRSHRRMRPSNRYLLGSDANSMSASQALTALVLHSKLQSSCPDTALVDITCREPLPTTLISQPGPPHHNLTGTCATITHNGRRSEPSHCDDRPTTSDWGVDPPVH